MGGWGFSFVLEHLLSKHKFLDLFLRSAKGKLREQPVHRMDRGEDQRVGLEGKVKDLAVSSDIWDKLTRKHKWCRKDLWDTVKRASLWITEVERGECQAKSLKTRPIKQSRKSPKSRETLNNQPRRPCSWNWRMHNENAVHVQNGMLFSCKQKKALLNF